MNSPELPITLVIVDDHVLFRRGLISLLEAMPGMALKPWKY
jgi:DNA-binding NarL/FixJ family response regulator